MSKSTPLYILANKHNLPRHQYLDEETVLWIKDCAVQVQIGPSGKLDPALIHDLQNVYSIVRPLIPLSPKIFARGNIALDTIHGELHAYRVAIFAGMIAKALLGDKPHAYILSGLYHDIARINDKEDIGHGERSSRRAELLGLLRPHSLAGNISEAITNHDTKSPIKGLDTYTKVLMAGDALDRFRLPKLKWWPDTHRISLSLPKGLKSLAYMLVLESEKSALNSATNVKALDDAIDKLTYGNNAS